MQYGGNAQHVHMHGISLSTSTCLSLGTSTCLSLGTSTCLSLSTITCLSLGNSSCLSLGTSSCRTWKLQEKHWDIFHLQEGGRLRIRS